jgi:hypothetical protein
MMTYLRFCIIAFVGLLIGCQRDISGSYMAKEGGAVLWLQLVRTPDNRLTGQLATSTLKPDGTVERNSVPVTGAVDGENVTLSGSKLLGLEVFTLSGNLQGNNLTLSGGAEPLPIVFKRASLSDYQSGTNQLNVTAQGILAAKASAQAKERISSAEANFIFHIDRLVGRMQRFDSGADVHLGRLPQAETRYQAITAKMNGYVERERHLSGNDNAAVARSQLYVSANQLAIDTNQLHIEAQFLQSDFEGNVKPLAEEVTAGAKTCGISAPSLAPALTPIQIKERIATCDRFTSLTPQFKQKYEAMMAALAHLEQVYQRERGAQDRLMTIAQKLE